MTLTRVSEVGRDERANGALVDLDELCRLAAWEMIAVALEAERRAYLDAHAEVSDAAGRRLVVGNGYARERELTTAAGRVEIKAPRVHDRREGERFPRSSCGRSCASRRRSPRCCRCCTCARCRPATSRRRLEGFLGSERACPPRRCSG